MNMYDYYFFMCARRIIIYILQKEYYFFTVDRDLYSMYLYMCMYIYISVYRQSSFSCFGEDTKRSLEKRC
jgi:hypothetical protein